MPTLRRVVDASPAAENLLTTEWLVANGLGGYAAGTIAGAATRRYHGLLVAALPPPLGRTMMLNHVSEEVTLADGTRSALNAVERADRALALPGSDRLEAFLLEDGLPVWRFRIGGALVEKRVWMAHGANISYARYRVIESAAPLRLTLTPAVSFRSHDEPVTSESGATYAVRTVAGGYELSSREPMPPLRLSLRSGVTLAAAPLVAAPQSVTRVLYRVEENRGYPAEGALFEPGSFNVDLDAGDEATLVAATEPWPAIDAATPSDALAAEVARRRRLLAAARLPAGDDFAAELTLAADAFVIHPVRADAAGPEARTVIAGYHWFTDWGRDTMIALDGLTLATGRAVETAEILRTFARYVRDGLIPNYFPDGKNEGLYHTADATLWFFHAVDRHQQATGDRTLVDTLLPTLTSILEAHLAGTRFGIGVDSDDGLLRQGAEGYALTWMDAKMDRWVVTPRRGKAVEINALWYNALRLCEHWRRERGDTTAAAVLAQHAERAQASFNRRFFCAARGWLYDVVDGEAGDDDALRPNQIFAVSLPHPVLARARWQQVVEVVRDRLLTPVGLRSLGQANPQYQAKYWGDLRARDGAYHQGTVWSWLIGPFVDAWLRVWPDDRAGARQLLAGFHSRKYEACAGSIPEIFDAEPPFTPRGCVAQAWGVAEVLRAWQKTLP